jgi:hypothetical protein
MSRMTPIYTIYDLLYTTFSLDVRHHPAVWPSCWEHCWDLWIWVLDLCFSGSLDLPLDLWICGSVDLWISRSGSGSLRLGSLNLGYLATVTLRYGDGLRA